MFDAELNLIMDNVYILDGFFGRLGEWENGNIT